MPGFMGCRCCNQKITHRVFNSDGEHQWSKKHRSLLNPAGDGVSGFQLGGDDVAVTVNRLGTPFNRWDACQWSIPDGDLINQTSLLEEEFNEDTGDWQADNDGAIYRANNTFGNYISKFDPIDTRIWRYLVPGAVPSGSYSPYIISNCDVMHDGSLVAACYADIGTGGSSDVKGAGAVVLDSDGNPVWTNRYVWGSPPRPYPSFAEFDTDGTLYVFFATSVSDGTDTGSVWVFDGSGSLIHALAPAVTAGFGVKRRQNIYSNTVMFTGSGSVVYRYSLSDFSVETSFDFSSYGSTIQHVRCDQTGHVYVVIDGGTLLALDHDLTVLWEFHENGTNGIETTDGLQCNDSYVGIAGALKLKKFDPSQLVVYP